MIIFLMIKVVQTGAAEVFENTVCTLTGLKCDQCPIMIL